MKTKIYEKHVHQDMTFPFIFHKDFTETVSDESSFYYHWHESIEILNCISGSCICVINGKYYNFRKGDTLIIDPYSAHMVLSSGESGVFYCLIVDKSFFNSIDISYIDRVESPLIRSEHIDRLFDSINTEMEKHNQYWKQSVKAQVTMLIVDLIRSCIEDEDKKVKIPYIKNDIAENVIEYLYKNLDSHVTIDEIAHELGFNKYYLCHSFRQITGESIVGFLNMLRCNNAKKLLMSGGYTVSEAAELSGFTSFSYFTKTYRRYFGHTPSEDRE